MTTLRLVLATLLLSAGAVALAAAQEDVDPTRVGPQVGERVPDFALTDQNGETRTLDSIMGPNGALLVFHRSANW